MKRFKLTCMVNGDSNHTVTKDKHGDLIITFYQDIDPEEDIEELEERLVDDEIFAEYMGRKQSDMLWDVFDSTIEIVEE